MRALHTAKMFDRTPVLLGPGGDLGNVGKNTIRIGAILAVDLFNQVQVLQMVPVKGQVIAPPDVRDSVDRKADKLVKAADQIQQGDGHEAGVDDRRRNENEKSGSQEIPVQSLPEFAVLTLDFFSKAHLGLLDFIAVLLFLLVELLDNLLFQVPNFRQ